jgi:hypothetical protein
MPVLPLPTPGHHDRGSQTARWVETIRDPVRPAIDVVYRQGGSLAPGTVDPVTVPGRTTILPGYRPDRTGSIGYSARSEGHPEVRGNPVVAARDDRASPPRP